MDIETVVFQSLGQHVRHKGAGMEAEDIKTLEARHLDKLAG